MEEKGEQERFRITRLKRQYVKGCFSTGREQEGTGIVADKRIVLGNLPTQSFQTGSNGTLGRRRKLTLSKLGWGRY